MDSIGRNTAHGRFTPMHEAQHSQWVVREENGETAGYLTYEIYGNELMITSVQVRREFRGQGVGGSLVRAAVEYERSLGENKVVPVCSFARDYLARHPEFA